MSDSKRCARTLNSLHALGVKLSVDDYGTGYASLVYLKDLPIDELKIDRSVVAGMLEDDRQRVLTQSVIDLGHHLGLSVVAEGVEDARVCRALRAAGCDVAQGFLFSEPITGTDILAGWGSYGAPADIPPQRTGSAVTQSV